MTFCACQRFQASDSPESTASAADADIRESGNMRALPLFLSFGLDLGTLWIDLSRATSQMPSAIASLTPKPEPSVPNAKDLK